MTRFKELLREPALLIDAAETLVVLFVAYGAPWNGDQQTYIVAAVIALVGVLKGFTTRPFPVTVVPDFIRAAMVLGASFGVGLDANQIALTATAVGTLMTLMMRPQITPNADPVIDTTGAGSGPVLGKTEGGYSNFLVAGAVILVLGVLVWGLTAYVILGVVLTVIGVILVVLGASADNGTGHRRL